jgi:hypothetical protein
MGLLTALHYDYVVDAAYNLATVVRMELTDMRLVILPCCVLFIGLVHA